MVSESDHSSQSSEEVRPIYSEDRGLLEDEEGEQNLADLTKVTSTSIQGLVVGSVLDLISQKGGDESDEEEQLRPVHSANYSATLARARTQGSETPENPDNEEGGFLIPERKAKVIIWSLFSLSFLASLDATVLSTLVTDIASDLGAMQYISWITTAYLLSTSIVQPLGGLSDIFGREPMLYGCLIVYTLGCLQCATAKTTASFVLGRFFSGFAGGLTTLGTIIMSDLIPLRRRGVYQGLGNMCYGLGSTVGGTFGGWVAHHFGWRMAFWCQVPYGILCIFIMVSTLKLPASLMDRNPYYRLPLREKLRVVDVRGIALLASALTIFIITTSFSFQSTFALCCMAGLFLLAVGLFLHAESVAQAPIVPVKLLKDRSVLGCSLSNMFGTMYTFVVMYYYPVYLSTVCGLNTEQIGVRVVPTVLALSVSSIFSGYYMKWTGKYWTFSLVVNIIGSAGLAIMLACTFPFGLNRQISVFEQYVLCVPALISYSAMLTVTLLALIAAVPIRYQASVTSIQYAFRGIGSVLGTSMGSQLFTTSLAKQMTKKVLQARPDSISAPEARKIIRAGLNSAAYIRSGAPGWAIRPMIESYGIGCWSSFTFSTVTSVLCLLAMATIKEYKLYSTVRRTK
ncbi:DEBR0S1_14994g1_1 [Brettanomyces bruxellensis]|uniref:DEBR0S1_14994g1_1 n=1 Tax=Dekkera bruxellensis TaxID=5007 RepID=A0A7D9GZ73_DEKBR|nr:DEBR0S1_14994g1_1 [Brettanomyces bruxellensis]